MEWWQLIVGLIVGAMIGASMRRDAPRAAREEAPPAAPLANEPPTPTQDGADAPAPIVPSPVEGARDRAWTLARALEDKLERIDDLATLEAAPEFRDLVDQLAGPGFDAQVRSELSTASLLAMSCGAFAAMARQSDANHADVARTVGRLGWFSLALALRHLGASGDPTVVALVLSRAKPWWFEHPETRNNLRRWLDAATALGAGNADIVPSGADLDGAQELLDVLPQLPHPLLQRYATSVRRALRARDVDRSIDRVGRWAAPEADDANALAHTPAFDAAVDALVATLLQPARPSLVLLGDPGCGKSSTIRAAIARLVEQGWRVLEANAEQIVAGQKYIGEIEARVEAMIEALSAPRTLWFAPACHTLLERGTYSGNPNGLLDALLPALEAGRIQMIGESERSAWAQVLAQRPRTAHVIKGVVLPAADPEQTRALVAAWARRQQIAIGSQVLTDAVAQEAIELARQHFPDRAEPGRSLGLLQDALSHARGQGTMPLPLTRDALLEALSLRSGIPLDVLDVERRLDVAAIRTFFTGRVMGQDEAVEALVDRVAMIKAGLTDPRRPLGVFLFAGPTGTGKTEIAKTLAELLFGSADRLLRFDMSEYQGDDAAWRLIDDGAGRRGASLTTRIREQPFSVVLLDEFEKASPRVWDLFLQVFDDGRLTDRAGSTVSFRHAIVILTSNLGATIDRGGGPGFVGGAGGLSRSVVQRAIDATFRREFINRIDQVVIFDPLTRVVMRDILEKELRLVLSRRGFQIRDWAVEWEPSAIDFLLERGFTVDLGARPLRRAIERHVLAPLARTIVEHRAPRGEQFLFVAAGGEGIEVRFVDPDATPAASPESTRATAEASDLRALALDPRADAAAMALIARELDELDARIRGPGFDAIRADAADAMQASGFWQRGDRAPILDRLERIDRIEAGLRGARSLQARLARLTGRSVVEPLRRLALLLHVLGAAVEAIEAGEPEHVRLVIQPRTHRQRGAEAWRDRLVAMYAAWAHARGMRWGVPTPAGEGRVEIEVGGFGAWSLLRDEVGVHVYESDDRDDVERVSATVLVRSEPAVAVTADPARIVRRYGTALVRDAVRGWRSGRVERVFHGDFDLIESMQGDSR